MIPWRLSVWLWQTCTATVNHQQLCSPHKISTCSPLEMCILKKLFPISFQSCSWKGNRLIKTLGVMRAFNLTGVFEISWVSAWLTAATCEPASTSASISARHLYCCGDSITISLLGALPARLCMLTRLAYLTRCEASLHGAAGELCWVSGEIRSQ